MTESTDTIQVTLNGEPRQIARGGSVSALLAELGLHPRLVVVEHNRRILDGTRFDETEVRAGDVVELVHFVGGG